MTPRWPRFGAVVVAVVVVLGGTALADESKNPTMSKDGVAQETALAMAAVNLSTALQVDNRRALDVASLEMTRATKAFAAWLAAHPADRSPAIARIVPAAEKLVVAADRLRTLLDQHAAGPLVQQAAIDGLHRFNEFLNAHQGEPFPPELAMPAELVEQFVKMVERIGREVHAMQPDCDKIATALMAHVDEDAAVVAKIRAIDEARPQDQREAERAKGPPGDAARLAAAMKLQAPLAACKANAKLAQYRSRASM